MKHAYVHVYTGDGKGKTTAALGLALRAAGAGLSVFIGQFMKRGRFSELRALRKLGSVRVEQYGTGAWVGAWPTDEQIRRAAEGLTGVKTAMHSSRYDVVILDEINCAVRFGLIPLEAVLELLAGRPPGVELADNRS